MSTLQTISTFPPIQYGAMQTAGGNLPPSEAGISISGTFLQMREGAHRFCLPVLKTSKSCNKHLFLFSATADGSKKVFGTFSATAERLKKMYFCYSATAESSKKFFGTFSATAERLKKMYFCYSATAESLKNFFGTFSATAENLKNIFFCYSATAESSKKVFGTFSATAENLKKMYHITSCTFLLLLQKCYKCFSETDMEQTRFLRTYTYNSTRTPKSLIFNSIINI